MERFTRKLVPALFALTSAVPASMDTAIKARTRAANTMLR